MLSPDTSKNVIIRRNAAIGDVLSSTVVADKMLALGYGITYQSHPNIHCVLRRLPGITKLEETGAGPCHINLDGAYEGDPQRRLKHFHWMFIERAQEQLYGKRIFLGDPLNCKPKMEVSEPERDVIREEFKDFPHPWIMVCPRSNSYAVRQVQDGVWAEAVKKMPGTVFWLGNHGPAPQGFVDLHAKHLDRVILWISVADLMVSVDTGPLHLAAALGIPIVALGQSSTPEQHLSDQCDFVTIEPKLPCLNCQKNLCPITQWDPPCQKFEPEFIAAWVEAKLRAQTQNGVSAVVTIWKPEVAVLNKCLECVLPQVEEVIVTVASDGIIPANAKKHDRIRYVRSFKTRIGYAGNANFGARHTNHRNILFINDDVFLNRGAVEKLMHEKQPDVGIVSGILYYPNGTIYHAGKTRSPGAMGWGHLDLRRNVPTYRQPVEMENVNGAMMLLDRKTFYEVDCFDEELKLFANDDDICLKTRRAGKRIIFTPHASGTHLEHQSVNKVGQDIMQLVRDANRIFDKKWRRYLEHNLNRIPGNFDYV